MIHMQKTRFLNAVHDVIELKITAMQQQAAKQAA